MVTPAIPFLVLFEFDAIGRLFMSELMLVAILPFQLLTQAARLDTPPVKKLLLPGLAALSSHQGHPMPDRVHMCLSVPRKRAVLNLMVYMRGKSAITVACNFGSRARTSSGTCTGREGISCPRWKSMKTWFGRTSASRSGKTSESRK